MTSPMLFQVLKYPLFTACLAVKSTDSHPYQGSTRARQQFLLFDWQALQNHTSELCRLQSTLIMLLRVFGCSMERKKTIQNNDLRFHPMEEAIHLSMEADYFRLKTKQENLSQSYENTINPVKIRIRSRQSNLESQCCCSKMCKP